MDRSSMSVRALTAIVASCALLCLGAANAGAAPLAVVGTVDSHEVSLIDTAKNQPVGGPIEVEGGVSSVAITPDGRFAYVDNINGSVTVINTVTRKTVGEPTPVAGIPFGIAIAPDGSRAYVTDLGPEVSVIDTKTNKVIDEIEVSGESVGVAVSPDGKFAYVTVGDKGVVEAIDTETMQEVGGSIEVGGRPSGIELAPDGRTAYVVDRTVPQVSVIDTATGKFTRIPVKGMEPRGIVVAPDGKKAFVVEPESNSVSVIDIEADREIEAIPVGKAPQEVAISADGKTVYVTTAGPPLEPKAEVERIDVETGSVIGPPIELPGEFASGIAIAPDQSPVAAFAVPSITAGVPATFSGAHSTDADGTIASYSWTFGDGGVGSGASVSHTYKAPGTYSAKLSVVDSEGCGVEEVFTGRTAYCSGAAPAVHTVTVKAPEAAPILAPTPPSNNFTIRRIVHNRRNGTVRLQVRLPSAGFVLLFGKKVHAVTRKSKGVQSMWLTLHARVELAKRLKKILRAPVRFRITFTPNGGTAKTVHRTVTLLRAPRHRHQGH